MMSSHSFHGSATVGERGQIVLPAKLREEFNINAGDKLLVMTGGPPGKQAIMIMKPNVLDDIISHMAEHYQKLLEVVQAEKGE